VEGSTSTCRDSPFIFRLNFAIVQEFGSDLTYNQERQRSGENCSNQSRKSNILL
jgi:hypothetical protein